MSFGSSRIKDLFHSDAATFALLSPLLPEQLGSCVFVSGECGFVACPAPAPSVAGAAAFAFLPLLVFADSGLLGAPSLKPALAMNSSISKVSMSLRSLAILPTSLGAEISLYDLVEPFP